MSSQSYDLCNSINPITSKKNHNQAFVALMLLVTTLEHNAPTIVISIFMMGVIHHPTTFLLPKSHSSYCMDTTMQTDNIMKAQL
jgi:hypothetical protein